MANQHSTKKENSQYFLPTSFRAAIIASSYWILSLSLTVLSGSVASFIGCLFACYLIDLGINRAPLNRLRTFTISTMSISMLLLGLLLASVVTNTTLLSNAVSPMFSFNTGEFIKWFAISASLTVYLRVLAQRTSFGAVVEILFVATAFVITLSAHRNGMIHRPFIIGDYALTRGIDPSSILMAFGCGAVLSLAALLMIENNHRRLPYHFTVLGLLCFSLIFYVRLFGLPTPQLTNGLGLTGQEQAGNDRQRENPFRDSQNNAADKETPVAVVVFRDDYEPLNSSYYFRESAYSQFNGTMLHFTTRSDMDQDLIAGFTNSRIEAEQLPKAEDQRVPVRATIGMLISHRTPFGLESPIAYENTANPNNLRFKRTYDSYSLAPEYDFNYLIGRELGREDWSAEVWDEYLELPDDPRYQELAQRLITDLKPEYTDDPFAKALAIKTYLDENGIYSLKNEHAYETDPTGSFLFGDLTGYCMHFSFAATYMFRSLGIPTRVGIGYAVPASNKAGGSSLLIQAVHGHAWPEVYFRDIGWVIIDPAPQQTLVDMTTDPQNNLQQLLGDMLRNDASFDDFMESQRTASLNLQLILNILYALILATLFSAYTVKFYRLWIPSRAGLNKQYRLSYRAMLDQLSAVGLHREFGESREQFATRAKQIAPSMEKMTQQHLALALGSADKNCYQQERWLQLRSAIAGEIRTNTETWKKVIAWVNPFSWLLSK